MFAAPAVFHQVLRAGVHMATSRADVCPLIGRYLGACAFSFFHKETPAFAREPSLLAREERQGGVRICGKSLPRATQERQVAALFIVSLLCFEFFAHVILDKYR